MWTMWTARAGLLEMTTPPTPCPEGDIVLLGSLLKRLAAVHRYNQASWD